MSIQLLERLSKLQSRQAKAKAELEVAEKQLAEALAELSDMGITSTDDLDALKATLDAKTKEFEDLIAQAEAEMDKLT